MKVIILASLLSVAYCMPQQGFKNQYKNNFFNRQELDDEDITLRPVPAPVPNRVAPVHTPNQWELEQNRNAHYQFSSNIDDKISDQQQQRTEVREGLKVEGSYSYSDGYFKRTYHYVADDKGYRIVGTEVVPLEGPKVDLSGTASVDSAAHGTQVSYKVQSVPAVGQKIVDQF